MRSRLTINSAFYVWNLPYNALLQFMPQLPVRRSPSHTRSTPSDIQIRSPTPNAVSSPVFSHAVSINTSRNRATLFVSGKFDELLGSLDLTEKKWVYSLIVVMKLISCQRILSNWLYEFWYFGFKTAKHWGRGPATWTASNLWPEGVRRYSPGLSSPSPAPAQVFNGPTTAAQTPNTNRLTSRPNPEPTELCRWSIHLLPKDDVDWSDDDSYQESIGINVEWPSAMFNASFEQKLQEGLETNSFSTVGAATIPANTIDIAKTVQRSPEELLKQSLAFAIIGRNALLVEQLCIKARSQKIDLTDIHPYHLATTYLDGATSCCQILHLIMKYHSGKILPSLLGPTGYTVLDNLMIAILRNHSSTLPETLDDNLRGTKRFGGEDVDICGRWDADSDCYQALLKNGTGAIPLNWKHKFCHTSVQVVCHAMVALRLNMHRCPPSGIFIKRCFTCGLKLQLPPMHTIVLTAFHLAQSGSRDEDLFGMICCVLCFTIFGKSSDMTPDRAQISVDLLLGDDSSSLCTHESLSAAQFAERLFSTSIDNSFPASARPGWSVICQILQQIEDQYTWTMTGFPPPGYEDECDEIENDATLYIDGGVNYEMAIWWTQPDSAVRKVFCDHMEFDIQMGFGRNRLLGHVWAACQCELLTYRRLRKGEPWTSRRVDVGILAKCLELGNAQEIPLIKEELLKEYCVCGLFNGKGHMHCLREHACTEYFSNLDDWDRTTFLDDTIIVDYYD